MIPSIDIVTIGGSSGSLDAVLKIFAFLKDDFKTPVIIVMHRGSEADDSLIKLLSSRTKLMVKEADEKDSIKEGYVYIAPPDYHLLVEEDKTLALDASDKVQYSRPSIDVTFESVAAVYKDKALAILLSGANADGTHGLGCIKKRNGQVIIQDPADAIVSFMPLNAANAVKADGILTWDGIADLLNSLTRQD